jgi:methionyl-tRNA formyltransferase
MKTPQKPEPDNILNTPEDKGTANKIVKIVLCGYGHTGLGLLKGLLKCPQYCTVTGVFRWVNIPGKQHHWEGVEKEFAALVAEHALLDIACDGVNSYPFTQILSSLTPDVLLFGSWGEIIKPHILDQSALTVINCHPAKLPAHQGANPYASVILHNETETGVTFHLMVSKIDAGDILLQESIPVLPTYTGDTLRQLCASTAETLVEQLARLLHYHHGNQLPLVGTPQDPLQQSYFPQLKPSDGKLNWQHNSEQIFRQMRALFPWMITYASLLEISWLKLSITVLFFAPSFQLVQAPGKTIPPGTLLFVSPEKLLIALRNETELLEVQQYHIRINQWIVPRWIATVLRLFLLRTGKQLQ